MGSPAVVPVKGKNRHEIRLNTVEVGGEPRVRVETKNPKAKSTRRVILEPNEPATVTITNSNSDESITVFWLDAGKITVFAPAPSAAGVTLVSSGSVTFEVNPNAPLHAAANFRTEPARDTAQDHSDVHMGEGGDGEGG